MIEKTSNRPAYLVRPISPIKESENEENTEKRKEERLQRAKYELEKKKEQEPNRIDITI